MIVLAIELSSKLASIALLRDGAVIAEDRWENSWQNSQDFFKRLPRLLETCSVSIEQVDVFIPGLGPGSFAGTRAAVSAARAFALPGGKTVLGQNSGQALALEILTETGTGRVTVLGDARRDQVWYAHFEREGEDVRMACPWSLHPADRIKEVLSADSTVVSPEWTRLAGRLQEACPSGCTLIEQDRFPHAGPLGAVALRRLAAGEQYEPPVPIYLHPPVFVEPRSAESKRS